jgi:hypothetical protein
MTNEETSKRLSNIFKKYENAEFNDIIKRGWVFCENEKQADLLFIGINPSYTKDAKPECYGYMIQDTLKPKKDNGYRRHYGVFETLASGVTANWGYMDLFYFRETEQAKIDSSIINSGKDGVEFVCEQLQLSLEILQDISPKVIVVCNKRIHDFFGKNKTDDNQNVWMGMELTNTEKDDVKFITGINPKLSDSFSTKIKDGWNPKIIFSRHLSRTKKELRESLKESIKYAFK